MFTQLDVLAQPLVTLVQDVLKLKAGQKGFRQKRRALIDIVRQRKSEQ
jgi:hypothetical protein